MGANVVRLVRTDHRRIRELLNRLSRRYRAGEALPAQLVTELLAHVAATESTLLPFAESRIDHLDDAYSQSLERLAAAGAELADAVHPVPAEVVEGVAAALIDHIEIEERAALQPLDESVTVERLRMLGENFRRARDARLKSKGESARRYYRPAVSRAELYERARYRGIEGRSTMSRSELLSALREGS